MMHTTSSGRFPSQDQHARAWEALAAEIAVASDRIEEAPPTAPSARQGSLTIIGSGIETLGFIQGDEQIIEGADAVFFCVADPATVAWIKKLRPDAYDLYVLYDDSKPRYTTYMQMAEALLHYVRQGKKVVGIYYGHPGIFVLSTHRAILIARREGHQAVMRPGISALDCLCADLGVDPSHPGMVTYEATDMLIRQRVPATTLHTVLWQVGLVGEMGYRRKGYINENFSILVSYLQGFYGDRYPVTNYIASRFSAIPPVIEVFSLDALHDPALQSRVTGISTFYLAPKDPVPPSLEMMARLGLMRPGQTARAPNGPLREIGRYGARERLAFRDFRRFKVPPGYQWQQDTAASRFLIALRFDPALADEYRQDPGAALRKPAFDDLSPREVALLLTQDSGAMQIAAKGSQTASVSNQSLLLALFKNRPLLRALAQVLRESEQETLMASLTAFGTRMRQPAEWGRMRTDIDLMQRDRLFPWNGVYHAESAGRLLVLSGDGLRARLFIDAAPVRGFSFRRGILRWQAGPGQPTHGFLRVDVDRRGCRRLIGSIWPADEAVPAAHNLILEEGRPGRQHPVTAVGRYSAATDALRVGLAESPERGRHLYATLNGAVLEGAIHLAGKTLSVGAQTFALETLWKKADELPAEYCGTYQIRSRIGEALLEVGPERCSLNGRPIMLARDGNRLTWTQGPASAASGEVNLTFDPITLSPILYGTIGKASVIGMICPSLELQRPEAEFGLGAVAWQNLVNLQKKRPWETGIFVWNKWERSYFYSNIINNIFLRTLP